MIARWATDAGGFMQFDFSAQPVVELRRVGWWCRRRCTVPNRPCSFCEPVYVVVEA